MIKAVIGFKSYRLSINSQSCEFIQLAAYRLRGLVGETAVGWRSHCDYRRRHVIQNDGQCLCRRITNAIGCLQRDAVYAIDKIHIVTECVIAKNGDCLTINGEIGGVIKITRNSKKSLVNDTVISR